MVGLGNVGSNLWTCKTWLIIDKKIFIVDILFVKSCVFCSSNFLVNPLILATTHTIFTNLMR